MKKTVAWYNLLLEKGLLEFKEGDESEKGEEPEVSEQSKDEVKNSNSETDLPAAE